MKKLLIAALATLVLNSCTKEFESLNQNPNQITDASLQQDFNLVGSPFSGMLFHTFGHQIEEDLCHDNWMGYMASPTPFTGNINNTTYYMRWRGAFWNRVYGNVMSPSKQVIRLAEENDLPLFATWAKLIRVLAIHKVAAIHGPVIYSQYGSTSSPILYDSEPDLYNTLFAQLDSIHTDFSANKAYKGFAAFDPSYKGNIESWLKLVNSLRLRLAMRLSKVSPSLAKAQGEKALSDPAGLITTNSENFLISQLGGRIPVAVICFDWNDTRMGGPMESFMVGLKDGRLAKYFSPVSNLSLVADHPDFPYKGIRNGAYLDNKTDREPFSQVSRDFITVQTRRSFTASEVAFLKAEAALRGWAGAGDAKTNYENGVKLSFADWGASGVDDYLADNTSTPIDYVDPVDSRNDFTAVSEITVAWDDNDSDELKLEKIITQKYLAAFTNTLEAWTDFRRTGYPKIPAVAKNDSNGDYGVITVGDFIKRMNFADGERNGNAAGVADAVTKLGGPDVIGTRLWWDTGNPSNF